jgi:cephalosporin-C deacetylase-like acetyl esterase
MQLIYYEGGSPMIKKGSLVEIEKIDFNDKYSDVKVFIRGLCLSNCDIGDFVTIKTITGHIINGVVSNHKFFYYSNKKIKKYFEEILLIKKCK